MNIFLVVPLCGDGLVACGRDDPHVPVLYDSQGMNNYTTYLQHALNYTETIYIGIHYSVKLIFLFL